METNDKQLVGWFSLANRQLLNRITINWLVKQRRSFFHVSSITHVSNVKKGPASLINTVNRKNMLGCWLVSLLDEYIVRLFVS